MPPTAGRWIVSSRILAESLLSPEEPLALLVAGGAERTPPEACDAAARALLGLAERKGAAPPWLLGHQVPAFERLHAMLDRFGGALLADAVGLGKSYVSLAVAATTPGPAVLVVPAVLVRQWTTLAQRLGVAARVITHERLSRGRAPGAAASAPFLIVDEAHRFRNPDTRRYRALARLAIGAKVLLVTATPVHNRLADLLHLLRLFLRDDALVALGVPSLTRAARTGLEAAPARAAVARLMVARSRRRVAFVTAGLSFPVRHAAATIRAGPSDPARTAEIIGWLGGIGSVTGAGPLLRLTLLHRFASSLPALRHSLRRYEAYQALALEADRTGRRLRAPDFQRLFPPGEAADLQLAFLPLLLEPATGGGLPAEDLGRVRRLLDGIHTAPDPKAEALAALLAAPEGKTIVFVNAAATAAHLRARLAGTHRVGVVVGAHGWMGRDRAPRLEVLTAFAPRALGVPPPPAAARVDVLIATDLLSEGLNLQDAQRVIHYDLPWSPARLAQRVGRIDRLGSAQRELETVTFLPPADLARALAIERRLATKVAAQLHAGSAQVETVRGGADAPGPLDWCDRLQCLVSHLPSRPPPGVVTAVRAGGPACVLILRFGTLVDALVVEDGTATVDPVRATALMEVAMTAAPGPVDRAALREAVRAAADLVRRRVERIAAARWRAADRDRPGRRLVPLVLVAAQKAARQGRPARMARLDALVDRLTRGLTAGEELQLEALAGRPDPLEVRDLLEWHERLPPNPPPTDAPVPELVAAVLLQGGPPGH